MEYIYDSSYPGKLADYLIMPVQTDFADVMMPAVLPAMTQSSVRT